MYPEVDLGEEKCEMESVRSSQVQTADNCAVVCKSSGLRRSSVASGHTSSSASVWSLDSIWLDTLRRTCGRGSEATESYSFVPRVLVERGVARERWTVDRADL